MSDLRKKILEQCYNVPGQTWPIELGWLYDTIQFSSSHVEIGTFCGRSLLASCGGITKNASVVCVDNNTLYLDKEWLASVLSATIKLLPPNINLTFLEMYSIDAYRKCYNDKMRFDSVFIDGCHEYAECKADIESWLTLLNPGGIICGHDYWPNHWGVMDAVNEVFAGKHSVFSGSRIWYYRI